MRVTRGNNFKEKKIYRKRIRIKETQEDDNDEKDIGKMIISRKIQEEDYEKRDIGRYNRKMIMTGAWEDDHDDKEVEKGTQDNDF